MVLLRSMFRRKKRDEEGQGTVEFALILPILLLVIFGIIDFGWLFFNETMLSNIARSSARKAVVSIHDYAETEAGGTPVMDPGTNDVKFNKAGFEAAFKDSVKNALPGYLQKSSANLVVKVDEADTASSIKNKTINVSVEVDIPLFTPVLSTIHHSNTYRIRRTVKMRREY